MDNSNGLFAPAKAYYNIRGQGTIAQNDVLTLREADDKIINEGGRKAYKLYRNDTELIDVQNQIPVYFTDEGDIYIDEIDNIQQISPPVTGDEFKEVEILTPEPEEKVEPIPDEVSEERKTQLLTWRNNLYTTNRNTPREKAFNLDNDISVALTTPNKLTLLDKSNGNIPASIAYLNMDLKPIQPEQITSLELRQVSRSEIPSGGNDAFLLYYNDILARDNNGQQILYNEYGDKYSSEDIRGENIVVDFPFRPSSRDDLGIQKDKTPPQEQTTNNAKDFLENRRQALINWSIPPEDEKYRTNLLNMINIVISMIDDDDKINEISVPILSNSNYDLAPALAYLKAYEKSGNIPELTSNTKINMIPSLRVPGLNFLTINGIKYDRVGDYLLLNTGFGERIKMQGMKIEGVARINPEGFQASDSFTKGRISNMEQGGTQNPIFYSIESIISKAPEIQDYYNQIKGGN